jgi:LL-diaminopimelate aminotransferase
MAYVNEHYLKLQAGYLFPEIERRVRAFMAQHPDTAARIIRCGIGDVTEPIPAAAIAAMHKAIDELGDRLTFRGYGPATGYEFVRSAIAQHDYRARGIEIADDEIFLSDGSKGDGGAILDILGESNRVAIPDPVYPVYVDSNVMAGRTGEANGRGGYEGIVYLPGTPANGFVPELPREKVDVIYLCFPNNPTGATISRQDLAQWVKYALANESIILYDAAYADYIAEDGLPRSIFEIEGARECAIEFRSFSKNGGFTGVRCGCTVMPKSLQVRTRDGRRMPLHPIWMRRWSTKSNGVSYPIQRATEALYSEEGKQQVRALIDHYMGNASVLRKACDEAGLRAWGGVNAPYLWVKCPEGVGSWELFDRLLKEANVVVTPGAGFGSCGEGFFRISAFNSRANVIEASIRLKAALAAMSGRETAAAR